MCAFPKTKLGAGVPCLPGTTLAMSPGGMGRAPPPPRQRACRLAPPRPSQRTRDAHHPHHVSRGSAEGDALQWEAGLPPRSCPHLHALPSPRPGPRQGGGHTAWGCPLSHRALPDPLGLPKLS